MPKNTRKYVAALEVAPGLQLPDFDSANELYQALNAKNFFWDSAESRWLPGSAPNPATEILRIRVWAETSKVKDLANTLVRQMERSGFSLIERSEPYVCRPPNQLESRVYLTFLEEK